MVEATLLALGSAALHAGWNLLVKTSRDRFLAAWSQFVLGALIGAPFLLLTGLPDGDSLPYLGASSLVHVAYIVALVRAYEHGEFSVTYPLARGGGALLAGFGGVLFLSDHLSAWSWLAIAVVVLGLASLTRPHPGRAALLWAGATAVTIGMYTTLDAAGSRRTDSGVAYGIAIFVGAALALSIFGIARGRAGDLRRSLSPDSLRRSAVGGAASVLAYAMVLVAVRLAPVGYVAALRESSVVLGAAAGWLLLGERLGRARLVASGVVAAGLVLLVVTR